LKGDKDTNMKKINLLVLPLIALTIAGCSKTSTSSSQPTSETPISQKTSADKTSSSGKVSSSESKASSAKETTKESSSSSVEEEPVSSSQDIYSLGWTADVVNMMLKYLEGVVIPYVNLGASKTVSAEWEVGDYDYGVLTIYGSKEWTSTTSNEVATALANGNWHILDNTTSTVNAYDPDYKVKVTVERLSVDDPTVAIKATYDEPYDLSKATNSWDSDVTQAFTDTVTDVAPYVYLGTTHPEAVSDDSTNTVTITGGKWNDKVLTDAKTTLETVGYTVNVESSVLTATGKASDTSNDKFYIQIKESNGSSYKKITMIVTREIVSDADSFTSWPADVESEIKSNLDNHTIPAVYLGTASPTLVTTSTGIEIRGKKWDNTAISNNIQKWTDDGWTIKSNNLSAYSVYSKSITYTKTFSDKCVITAAVKGSYYYGAYIQITFDQGMTVPDTSTDWSTDIQTLMTSKFGIVLPYVYLNTASETASYDDTENTMTIIGGSFIKAVSDEFVSKYNTYKDTNNNKVFTCTVKSDNSVKAVGTIDNNKYIINLTKDSSTSQAVMTINFLPPYADSIPENGEWNKDVKDKCNSDMDGHLIPYVYLRTLNPTVTSGSSYNTGSSYFTINGGEWDEGMITQAKTVYTTADGWTIKEEKAYTNEYNPGSITFEKDWGDGCSCTVKLSRYSNTDTYATLTVTPSETYVTDEDKQPTAWSKTTETGMSAFGETIPYVYLGTRKDAGVMRNSAYLLISGVAWNDEIPSKAAATYQSKGWTVIMSKNNYNDMMIAYKPNDTNTLLTTVIVSETSDKKPQLTAYHSTYDATITKDGSYADTFLSEVQTFTGNSNVEIPYVPFGNTLTNSTSGSAKYMTYWSDVAFNAQRAILTYEILTEQGWTCTLATDGTTDLKVTAEKKFSDKSKVKLEFTNSYKSGKSLGRVYINYYPPFVAPEGVTDWSAATKTQIEDLLGHCLPYFYIGSADPEFDNYDDYIQLRGDSWDDEVYQNMINAITADADENGNSYWSYTYDYSQENPRLIATRAYDDGTHGTIVLYKNGEYAYVEYHVR
jgi:hypothetical protein